MISTAENTTGWITKTLYCQRTGMTEGQIRGKIQRRVWQDGVHYAVRDGGTWLHVENIEAWLTNGNTQPAAAQATREALKSAGNTMVRRTRNILPKPPMQLV